MGAQNLNSTKLTLIIPRSKSRPKEQLKSIKIANKRNSKIMPHILNIQEDAKNAYGTTTTTSKRSKSAMRNFTPLATNNPVIFFSYLYLIGSYDLFNKF